MQIVEKKRLYIVIFTAKATGESFIKVGISGHAIDQRFARDIAIFDIDIIFETEFYQTRDALIVESNFHSIISRYSYIPKIRLRSGNTECFINSTEVLVELARIFNSKKAPPAKPVPKTPRLSGAARRARSEACEASASRWLPDRHPARHDGDYHGGNSSRGVPYKGFG